jgi:elongation factor P--beta-lysine ligase
MKFSDSTYKQGIVERARKRVKLDSVQFPISEIVASANDYLDECAGYMIGNDRRFQWHDTNLSLLMNQEIESLLYCV